MAGVSGVGLSWSSKVSVCPSPKPSLATRRVSSVVKMAVSVEKKPFSLQKSEEIFNAAKELMPGGVNSPVRAFKSVGGQPIVFDSVKGSRVWDVDGIEYIDYVGSWGPDADDKVRFNEGTFDPPVIPSSVDLPTNLDVFGQKIDLSPLRQTLNPLQEAVANIARAISGQPPLKVPIPGDRTASWLITTYLDKDLRISRGDGGLFILAKEGSPLLDQLS